MKRQELERIMKRLEREILPRLVSSLSSKKDETNDYSNGDFEQYAYDLYVSTRQAFLEMLEENNIRQLEPIARVAFMGYAVSHFNKVFYPDHKFIFAISYTDEERDYHFGFTTRELIRTVINYIPEKAVPLIHAKTKKGMAQGELTRVRILADAEDLLNLDS